MQGNENSGNGEEYRKRKRKEASRRQTFIDVDTVSEKQNQKSNYK